jgi:hypothetical protein
MPSLATLYGVYKQSKRFKSQSEAQSVAKNINFTIIAILRGLKWKFLILIKNQEFFYKLNFNPCILKIFILYLKFYQKIKLNF